MERAPRFIRELEARDSLRPGPDTYAQRRRRSLPETIRPDGIYLIRWMVRLSGNSMPAAPVAAVALDGPADAVRSVYRFARCGESRAAQSNRRARNFSAQRKGSAPVMYTPEKETLTIQEGLTWAVYELGPAVKARFNPGKRLCALSTRRA